MTTETINNTNTDVKTIPVAKTPEQLKAEREAVRASIEVTTGKKEEPKTEEPKTEEVVEVVEEKIEEVEKTEEELAAEQAEAKTAAEKARIQRRIDKEVAKRKVLENEINDLKKQLAAKQAEGEEVLTKETVEREARRLAQQQVAEEDFIKACNKLAVDAKKIDKKFDEKINALAEDIGPIPSQIIGILDDLDNGGAVLNYLANNIEEAEDIWNKSMARQSSALAKISLKLEEAAKPKPKPVSKVPDPINPINGKGGNTTQLTDKMSTEDWIKARNAQVAEREQQKRMRGGR